MLWISVTCNSTTMVILMFTCLIRLSPLFLLSLTIVKITTLLEPGFGHVILLHFQVMIQMLQVFVDNIII